MRLANVSLDLIAIAVPALAFHFVLMPFGNGYTALDYGGFATKVAADSWQSELEILVAFGIATILVLELSATPKLSSAIARLLTLQTLLITLPALLLYALGWLAGGGTKTAGLHVQAVGLWVGFLASSGFCFLLKRSLVRTPLSAESAPHL